MMIVPARRCRHLEWLLVSNWQQRHDTWLKPCAYAVATGNAFYSR
jgi:hypothetical protein